MSFLYFICIFFGIVTFLCFFVRFTSVYVTFSLFKELVLLDPNRFFKFDGVRAVLTFRLIKPSLPNDEVTVRRLLRRFFCELCNVALFIGRLLVCLIFYGLISLFSNANLSLISRLTWC